MKWLITGAGGFLGRVVANAFARNHQATRVWLLDTVPPPQPADARFQILAADLTRDDLSSVLHDLEGVIHLASIPGGTAEADPRQSRLVNVDATLSLLEQLEATGRQIRVVYASSIAVLGEHTEPVTDATRPRPSLTYGAHKLMGEIALSDFHRRGRVSGISLRLPGIVARPRAPSGLRSAFMSDIFHAAAAAESFVLPVGPEASMWLMSATRAAGNLLHAAFLPATHGQAITLPALRLTARALVAALYTDPARVTYQRDADLEAKFGALPALHTPAAEALGFAHDGSVAALIAAVRAAA